MLCNFSREEKRIFQRPVDASSQQQARFMVDLPIQSSEWLLSTSIIESLLKFPYCIEICPQISRCKSQHIAVVGNCRCSVGKALDRRKPLMTVTPNRAQLSVDPGDLIDPVFSVAPLSYHQSLNTMEDRWRFPKHLKYLRRYPESTVNML